MKITHLAFTSFLLIASSHALLDILFQAFVDLTIGLPAPPPLPTIDVCTNLTISSTGNNGFNKREVEIIERDGTAVPKANFVVSAVEPVSQDIFKVVGNIELVDAVEINAQLGVLLDFIELTNTGYEESTFNLTSSIDIKLSNIAEFSFSFYVKATNYGNNVCCLPDDLGFKFHWNRTDPIFDIFAQVFADVSVYSLDSAASNLNNLLPINPNDFLSKRSDEFQIVDVNGNELEKKDLSLNIDLSASLNLWATSNPVLPNFCWPCLCSEPPSSSSTPASSTPASSTPASSTPASTPASSTPASTPASSTPASTPASSTPASSTPASSTPASSTPALSTPASTPASSTLSSSTSGSSESSSSASSSSETSGSSTGSSSSPGSATGSSSGSSTGSSVSSNNSQETNTSNTTPSSDATSSNSTPEVSSSSDTNSGSTATSSVPNANENSSESTITGSSTSLSPEVTTAGFAETVTKQSTTVITITSCLDNKCTNVPVTTGVTVITESHTLYTTYCPLTSEIEADVTTQQPPFPIPTSTPATSITSTVDSTITLTSSTPTTHTINPAFSSINVTTSSPISAISEGESNILSVNALGAVLVMCAYIMI